MVFVVLPDELLTLGMANCAATAECSSTPFLEFQLLQAVATSSHELVLWCHANDPLLCDGGDGLIWMNVIRGEY
jgi:hypothetical protein